MYNTIHDTVLIRILVVHSFGIEDGPGIPDNDWLLGAEADSPDLNIAALTFGETRLRYL